MLLISHLIFVQRYYFSATYQAFAQKKIRETGKQGNVDSGGFELGVSNNYDNKFKINNRIIYLFINFPRSKLKPP